HGANHLDGIERVKPLICVRRRTSLERTVLDDEIQSSPQQLGPHILLEEARSHTELLLDRARSGKGPHRVEPSLDPSPFGEVSEDAAHDTQHAILARGGPWLPRMFQWHVQLATIGAALHGVDRSDKLRGQFPCPLLRRRHLGMVYAQPQSYP